MDPAQRIEEPPITGDPPSPINPPRGCRFRTRCPLAEPVCEARAPTLGEWLDRALACRRLPHRRIRARATAAPSRGMAVMDGSILPRAAWRPLVEVEDLTGPLRHARRDRSCGQRRHLQRAARRGAVHPRRIRLGQERHPARADAAAAGEAGDGSPGASSSTARTCWRSDQRGLARAARRAGVDDLPGADDGARPGLHDRPADRRDGDAAQGRQPRRRPARARSSCWTS